MAKDPLLTEKFFSSDSKINQGRKNEEALNLLIKRTLYPNLSADINPVYYQGAHTLSELTAFTNKPEYTILQQELALTIERIKSWGDDYEIEGTETLITFKQKLVTPSDRITLLYADGKKFLETIAVLLEDTQLGLQNRKTILTNLLADKELEKCINGCYSRIANAATHLQENLEGNQNIQHWIRSFVTDKARQVATQRPFAMPDSYQILLCKASDCSEREHGLHANNYLLLEAKKHGFPVDNAPDQGAVELGRGMGQSIKEKIIERYIVHLEKEITAKNLVNFLSDKLHEDFQQVMSSELDYVHKMEKIENKLNVLGEDPWFTSKAIGLSEIISAEGDLKERESLTVTVTERLIQRGLLNAERIERLNLGSASLFYRRFSSVIELTWFLVDAERKPFLSFMKEERFYELNYFQEKPGRIVASNSFRFSSLIRSTEDLILVVKNCPKKEFESFLVWVSVGEAVSLVKTSDSPTLFMEFLDSIPDQGDKRLFLNNCGDIFIRRMLEHGIFRVDFKMRFPGLAVSYTTDNYDVIAKREGLRVTRTLIKELIGSGFKKFDGFNFYEVKHLAYLDDIDFSKTSLKNASFFQSMMLVRFDEAELAGTKFWRSLRVVSFKKTDLKEAIFWPLLEAQYSLLSLEDALLSTQSFKCLRSADIIDFTGADLRAVDFQHIDIKNRLRNIDFSKANLAGVDFSNLDISNSKLVGANLAKANLRNVDLHLSDISPKTNFKESKLSLSLLDKLYTIDIKIFDECCVFVDEEIYKEHEVVSFQQTSFKNTRFIGSVLKVNFIESDLTKAVFSRHSALLPVTDGEGSKMYLSIQTQKSTLDEVMFRDVKFSLNVEFSASSLKNLVFDRVEMDSTLLFMFYELGNRNFKGVNDLKGEIPKKLLPFPVLNAELNKQTFLHLYRKGLRDFRGSNLNSFYLGQVLLEQAISEIDLKLEGTLYKPFALGCGGLRRKRAGGSSNAGTTCVAYFIFQSKRVEERILPRNDIDFIARSEGQRRFVVREHVLGIKKLFTLEEQVTQVNFYWGYRPEVSDLIKSLRFSEESIASSARGITQLKFYIYKQYSAHEVLRIFANDLGKRGFTEVSIKYFYQQNQLYVIHLKNGVLSRVTEQQSSSVKILEILNNSKPNPVNSKTKQEEHHARLRRIGLKIRTKLGQGFQAGVRSGWQYDIGLAVMHVISQWLINRNPESKAQEGISKETLKQLAQNTTLEVGRERGANEQQMETALRVAEQCIDQGECGSEELVIRDVTDSMQRMRPDLLIGNEYAWKKMKNFFTNIGNYLSVKFDDIKEFFNQSRNQTFMFKDHSHWSPSLGLYRLNRKVQKRQIVTWYEFPLLLRLIKEIEAAFVTLGYDMQSDDTFSEEILAEFLFEFWQALTKHGISSHSSSESILNLIENNTFIEQFLTLLPETPLELPFSELAVADSQPNDSSAKEIRRKRAIPVRLKLDKPELDKIEKKAEDYLMKYESIERHISAKKSKVQIDSHFLLPLNQPNTDGNLIIEDDASELHFRGLITNAPAIPYFRYIEGNNARVYHLNVHDLTMLVDTLEFQSGGTFITFKHNAQQCYWRNKQYSSLPLTLYITGQLGKHKGYLTVEEEGCCLKVVNEQNNLLHVENTYFDYSDKIGEKSPLLGVFDHEATESSTQNNTLTNDYRYTPAVPGQSSSHPLFKARHFYRKEAPVFAFQTKGINVFHRFLNDRRMMFNKVAYCVRDGKVFAIPDLDNKLNGGQLLHTKYANTTRPVAIFLNSTLHNSTIENDWHNAGLTINGAKLYNLANRTEIFFSDAQPYSVKLIKESLHPFPRFSRETQIPFFNRSRRQISFQTDFLNASEKLLDKPQIADKANSRLPNFSVDVPGNLMLFRVFNHWFKFIKPFSAPVARQKQAMPPRMAVATNVFNVTPDFSNSSAISNEGQGRL